MHPSNVRVDLTWAPAFCSARKVPATDQPQTWQTELNPTHIFVSNDWHVIDHPPEGIGCQPRHQGLPTLAVWNDGQDFIKPRKLVPLDEAVRLALVLLADSLQPTDEAEQGRPAVVSSSSSRPRLSR